jgi:hypothetical protein
LSVIVLSFIVLSVIDLSTILSPLLHALSTKIKQTVITHAAVELLRGKICNKVQRHSADDGRTAHCKKTVHNLTWTVFFTLEANLFFPIPIMDYLKTFCTNKKTSFLMQMVPSTKIVNYNMEKLQLIIHLSTLFSTLMEKLLLIYAEIA